MKTDIHLITSKANVCVSSPSGVSSSVIGILTVFAAEDPAGNVNVSLTKFPTSVLSDPVYTKCTTVAESN